MIRWSSLLLAMGIFSAVASDVDPDFAQAVKDEVQVGRAMAARLLGGFGYDRNSLAQEKYLNLVGQSLVQISGRPELVYHFAILEDAEVNAFATPGGYIFVTRGLLNSVHNEDELACVLGHEIAHVNQKHMYKDIAVKRKASAGEVVSRLLSRGGADIGGALTEAVSKGMKMLVEEGLSKDKEFEADSIGIQYAAAAGYNPRLFVNLISRLDRQKNVVVAKTHPIGKDRIENIEKSLKQNGLKEKSRLEQDVLSARFAKALTRNAEFL